MTYLQSESHNNLSLMSTAEASITFEEIACKIEGLSSVENVDTKIIGRSVSGKPIYSFHVGHYDKNQIIITSAIHAREWITALLVEELVKIYSAKKIISGGIYFVPLCNPDGVQIALNGESLWKANARGVDLNVNFDADWGGGAQNVREPGPENFIGPHPNSEPEVKALIEFTSEVKPRIVIAYHSKGEVIYHGFEPSNGKKNKMQFFRDFMLAKRIGRITGYAPVKTENSTGGYSDWVSMHLGIPALTIEVGKDEYLHPIDVDKLPGILNQNKNVPLVLIKTLRNYIKSP